MTTPKTKRIDRAIQLRDHALSILRRHGSYQPAGDAKFLMYRGDTFSLMHRTPFQRWSEPNEAAKKLAAINGISIDHARYAAALHGLKLPEPLPYGLDIWCGKKVMSLEWAEDGRAHIISFRRGEWEEELLTLPPEEMTGSSDAA